MKSNLILSLIATAIAVPTVDAEVTNRVTLSGNVHSVSTPVVRTTGNSTTSTSTIVHTGITNSTLLDALVVSGDISSKQGYSISQTFDNEGHSQGYIAINARTGDSVAISVDILGSLGDNGGLGILGGTFQSTTGITATTSGSRTTNSGTVESGSTQSITTGSAFMFGTVLNAYAVSSTKLSSKTFRSNGSVSVVPYTSTTSTTTLRGTTDDNTVIDASVKSTSGTVSQAN